MSLIHSDPVCRDIAIWYDEFLTPGESFEDSIDRAMKESKLFTLLVTPSLLEENNYVKCVEYPRAVESGLPVLPAEKKKTDRKALAENFKNLPEVVNANDEELFRNAFMEAVKGIARHEKRDDPMHNFLMGLAYLNGIDVEVNTDYGVELVTKAAEAELPEAMEKLYNMYRIGEYVDLNYKKACFWAEKLYEFFKREKGENDSITLKCMSNYANICFLNGYYIKAKKIGKQCYEKMCYYNLSKKEYIDVIITLNNLACFYSMLGKYKEALHFGKICYEINSHKFGEKNNNTLITLNNLASFYSHLNNYEKAIELAERCYKTRCKILGALHPYTLATLDNIAIYYEKLGDYEHSLKIKNEYYKFKKRYHELKIRDFNKYLSEIYNGKTIGYFDIFEHDSPQLQQMSNEIQQISNEISQTSNKIQELSQKIKSKKKVKIMKVSTFLIILIVISFVIIIRLK